MTVEPKAIASRSGASRREVLAGGTALALAAACRPAMAQTLSPQGFAPPGAVLVFHDEFTDPDVSRINENATGGRPDAPAWRSRYRQDRFTVINQEKQIYMDPTFHGTAHQPLGVQPFSIANGILTISANRADPAQVQPYLHNFAYTSGCITSELTHWQTYGYYEMRAKLPAGRGFWPAFWLLPKAPHWPPEIDVFEAFGHLPTQFHVGCIDRPNHAPGQWIKGVVNTTTDFHTYGLNWTPETMTWSVDGQQVWQTPTLIREDMYVLANLAVGSHDPNYVPNPDATTPFPGQFQIDYIRVFNLPA